MITITGTATEQRVGSPRPIADAMIAGFRNSDETTPLAMTTTNAQGEFTLVINTNGEAIDGYLKATKAGLKDTYLYPPAPVAADTTAPIFMVTQGTFDTLKNVAGVPNQPGTGAIALVVVDGPTAQSSPVAGAMVSSTPAGTYRYNMNGFPSSTATSTSTDGLGYVFNVPAGQVTVSATKSGTTFVSHAVKARADELTTTLITP